VIAVVLAASIVAWVIIVSTETDITTAAVYKDSELIATFELSVITDEFELIVGNPDTGVNTILVRPGEIGVIEASCPDHVCIKTGFISNGIIPVVCLPNRLEIRIISDDGGLDAVVR